VAVDAPFDAWKADKTTLLLHKTGPFLLSQDRFFTTQEVEAKTIFELGIWDGGSTAFWFEYFQPDKLVAVDFLDREDSPTFRDYVTRKQAGERLKTYWRTDQSDRGRLAAIASAEFNCPLDLVIDDASHELHATRASFETLFPLLRSGGIYMIEDWMWETRACFREADNPWAEREGLVEFVRDFVLEIAKGSIRQLTVLPGFAAVERS